MPGRYLLLGGIIKCAHCGCSLYGRTGKDHTGKVSAVYLCNASQKRRHRDLACNRPQIKVATLEAFVLKQIKERALSDENIDQLERAAQAFGVDDDGPNSLRAQLDAIDRKIARATENLALVDPEDFRGVQAVIRQLWEDRKAIEDHAGAPGPITDEAIEAVKMLAEFREELHLLDRTDLALLISRLVGRITLGVKRGMSCRGHGLKLFYGRMEWLPGVCDEVIEFGDEDLHARRWREVASAIEPDETVTAAQLARRLGANRGSTYDLLTYATAAGLLSHSSEGFSRVNQASAETYRKSAG